MSALAQSQRQRTPRVLVYTATRGYRHDSIPTAIEVLGSRAADAGVQFSFTEDQGQFTDSNLAGFDCLMFVSNSDQVLDTSGEAALQNYFRSGGAYVGLHAASACLQQNTNYQQAVGAIFDYHPDLQPATFLRVNKTHPATANVPDEWRFTEEVYNFRSDPRNNGAQLLLSVNESSYTTWFIESPQSAQPLNSGAPKAGRSFYTSLGHSNETWRNATFQSHVLGGLTWALDGASTRSYGVGLVGNNTGGAAQSGSSNSASRTASASASGGTGASSGSIAPSGTASSSAAAGQSSRAAAEGRVRAGGTLGAVAVGAGAVALGAMLA
ncbi:putative glycosyl-hydrolase [Dioszegia hungarica]|uniref:Glycosyl-hydrolase n=1 Tax=Dioszegia hungarica TaxID=4972 RepID=A0AA38LSZ3_9TREE|nr:putative glycosyl-hydrolase [Dioszegia hungarica]KAI9634093.1 putative glycosyl-hydrolase [Dioszegia hungarica]